MAPWARRVPTRDLRKHTEIRSMATTSFATDVPSCRNASVFNPRISLIQTAFGDRVAFGHVRSDASRTRTTWKRKENCLH
jgi:hypothetical protein